MSKKPDKEGGKGSQGESEVGGRIAEVLKVCWNCGAGNYIPTNWSYFTCWSCGALCYVT